MDYLLTWRMALAQDLLRRRQGGIADVARRVGYGSASAFSVAFARHVGVPPGQFIDGQRRVKSPGAIVPVLEDMREHRRATASAEADQS